MKTLSLPLPLGPLLSLENLWQRSPLTSQVLHQLCPHGQVPQQCPHGQNLQSPHGQILQSPHGQFQLLLLLQSPQLSGKVLNTCTSGHVPKDYRHLYCLWCPSKFLSCTKIFIRPHSAEDKANGWSRSSAKSEEETGCFPRAI